MKKNIKIVLLALLILLIAFWFLGHFGLFTFKIDNKHEDINPSSERLGTNSGINIESDKAGNNVLVNISTGEKYTIENIPFTEVQNISAGNGFVAWTTRRIDPKLGLQSQGYAGGKVLEYDLWSYSFKTHKKELLVKDLDNNKSKDGSQNGNTPHMVVWGTKIVVITFAHKLYWTDYSNKTVQIVDVSSVTPDNLTINARTLFDSADITFSGNRAFFIASESGGFSDRYIVTYNFLDNTFSTFYASSGRQIKTLSINEKEQKLYWVEHAEWKNDEYHKKKI
jgi:hypothetical protein